MLQGDGFTIPANVTAKDLVGFLMEKGQMLSKWIAIVLQEDGVPLAKKDIDAMMLEIDFAIEPEQAMEVIRDFFGLQDLNSLSARIRGMVEEIEKMMMEQTSQKNGSKKSASSSPGETSPGETGSFGGSPSKNASLT